MGYFFLALLGGICAVGWFKNRMGLLTLAYYMRTKNYEEPTDSEARECSEWVIQRMFKRKDQVEL